jgi:hypothetical protein
MENETKKNELEPPLNKGDVISSAAKDMWRMLEEINLIMWESHMIKGRGLTERDGTKIMTVLEKWAIRY